ncbi:unnamed protein product [Nesidiocoris tenuis]|uniref:Tudor domain-containing protein n=1 Tax=Nesidiocoris tenuis TaxID=355587 RepID=A0A6H5HTI0_9HEMI|nr:unnamed protein product [Nesidiocoris tenuis]
MKFDRWEPKTKFEVVTVGSTYYNEFYAVRQSPIFDYVCNILTPEITKYCEQAGGSPYAPRQYEMVLAKYEGAWYRALCVQYGIGQPSASITFVDFGNHGDQPVDEIKPMAHDFMTTPATARACVIYGLPPAESLDDSIKKKLMKSYDAITEVYVVEDEGILECVVWVPQLVDTLKSLGIPFTAPVGFSYPDV